MKTLIRHAKIADGTGRPCFCADVVVESEVIAAIGQISPFSDSFDVIIDADGLVLSPGFIDMHSHGDVIKIHQPSYAAKLMQGITTEVVGQCGLGAAPITNGNVETWMQMTGPVLGETRAEWPWRSFGEYLQALSSAGMINNVAALVSHGALRAAVAGLNERPLTEHELADMTRLAQAAFAEGAAGFSTGLVYSPCLFADSRELDAMARVTAEAGGLFAAHVRNERDRIRESINEIYRFCRPYAAKVHISHLKVFGRENWGSATQLLDHIDQLATAGQTVSFDQYPYAAGSTMLSALLPPYAHDRGPDDLLARLGSSEWRQRMAYDMEIGLLGWENIGTAAGWDGILVTGFAWGPNKRWEGLSLAQIAASTSVTPQEAVFNLLTAEKLQVTLINFGQDEADVKQILQHPHGVLGTDGLPVAKPHPREYGSSARILGRYVREVGLLSMEAAVSRMTSRPAMRLGLWDRGLVRCGYKADLALFNPNTVADLSSYSDPCRHPTGIEYVMINGGIAVAHRQATGELHGQVLRRSYFARD